LFADGALAWLGGIGDIGETARRHRERSGRDGRVLQESPAVIATARRHALSPYVPAPWPAFGGASPDAHGFIVPSHAGSVLSYLRERRAEFRIVGLEWVLGRAGGVMDGLRVVWFFFRMGAVVAAKQ
jgi:hypothetical protein